MSVLYAVSAEKLYSAEKEADSGPELGKSGRRMEKGWRGRGYGLCSSGSVSRREKDIC